MTSYVKDSRENGEFRLPQERILEITSVLQAIVTLIDSVQKRRSTTTGDTTNTHHQSDICNELIDLYPTIVDCIPSCRTDSRIEEALIAALKAYKTMLLVRTATTVTIR
jgi:hypothetical protein